MRALILSAGLGERLRPLTLKRAKPAVEFLNLPMLGFPYFYLRAAGLNEVTFNTHYLPDSIRHAAMHVVDPSVPMHFSHEDVILGSGGGIRHARTFLDGGDHFAVANGDGVILCEDPNTLRRMCDFHEERDALATLLVCPLEGVGTRIPGVWMNDDGTVNGFGKSGAGTCFHYASFMFFSRRIWDYLPEGPSNILYDVLAARIAEGEKVYGFREDRMHWFETGNVADYLAATRTSLEWMRDGHPFGKCARAILDSLAPSFELNSNLDRLQLVADTADVEGTLEGFAVVGPECDIASGARVANSVLLEGVKLTAGESVRDDVRI